MAIQIQLRRDTAANWTADQGATNIHAGNYTDTDTTDHTAFSNIHRVNPKFKNLLQSV